MSELRVLQVLGRSAGGIGRHVARITTLLEARGDVHVDVAAPVNMEVPMPTAVREADIPDGLTTGHVRAVRAVRSAIAGGRYTVVHGHGLRAGVDAAIAARLSGVPCVVTLHNLVRPETSGRVGALAYRRGENLVGMLADSLFVVSEEMVERLGRRAGLRGKTQLLLLSVPIPGVTRNPTAVRDELGVPPGAPLAVWVGRFAPQKAVDVLLDALVSLPDAFLALIGDGPLRSQLEDKVKRDGTHDRVRFIGWKDQVGDYLAAADIFVLVSTWEARSLAAQEAILLDTPVVTTAVGGMTELVVDGESGWLVPPGDAKAVAAALASAFAQPELAHSFAAKARQNLMAVAGEHVVVERLVKEYRRLAARA